MNYDRRSKLSCVASRNFVRETRQACLPVAVGSLSPQATSVGRSLQRHAPHPTWRSVGYQVSAENTGTQPSGPVLLLLSPARCQPVHWGAGPDHRRPQRAAASKSAITQETRLRTLAIQRRQATFVADSRPAQRRCDATHPGQRTDSSYEKMKREGEGRYHSSHAAQVAEARPANTHISRAEKRRTCDRFYTRARFLYPRGVTLDLT